MTHMMVKFEEADQIIHFVQIMNRYEWEADIRCGSRIVDAKSLTGVMALAGSRPVELILHGDECGKILEEIAPYAA